MYVLVYISLEHMVWICRSNIFSGATVLRETQCVLQYMSTLECCDVILKGLSLSRICMLNLLTSCASLIFIAIMLAQVHMESQDKQIQHRMRSCCVMQTLS